MTPLCPKGLVNSILNFRLPGGPKAVDGFLGSHLDLDGDHPGLLEDVLKENWPLKCVLHLSDQRK